MANSRAANNMGTVRKRSDGRWEGRYTALDGKQHSVYGKSAAACTEALRAAQRDVDSGHWIEPSKLTVAEWMGIWLKDYQAHTSPRTVFVYEQIARLHIVPVIGEIKLARLSPMHVRRVINTMIDKGLSPRYIHNTHGVLSVALNAAMKDGIIKANPAKDIKTPPRAKTKFNIIDRDKFGAFIEAARKDANGNALIFALLTGLRASELRGLTWAAIDLNNGTMNIYQQLAKIAPLQFSPPKYGSTRIIELTEQAIALLKQQKKELAALRLAAGDKWETNDIVNDLVFRSAKGHFISESVMHKATHAIGAQIGVPALHPHDLRHSYAVASLRSGMDIKTLQHNMGHKNAAMTLDVYADYTVDAGKVGAQKLSSYFSDFSI